MSASTPAPAITTGRTAFRLLRYRPGLFLGTILFRGIDDLAPFATGLIIANLGIVGIYLGKVYEQTKGRPLYIVRRTTEEESTV